MSKQKILHICTSFCIVMFCTSCYLPAVRLFTDTLLLPKWYGCIFFGVLSTMFLEILKLIGRNVDFNIWMHFVSNAFVISSGMECLYVLAFALFKGMPPIGALGTFDNPTGLALNLCVAMPLGIDLVRKSRSSQITAWLYTIVCLLIAMTLYMTKSRTGMLCFVLYAIVYIDYGIRLASFSSCTKMIVFITLSLTLLTGAIYGISRQKPLSTSGRAFILQQSWVLIKERPLWGYGINGFERTYMRSQADFFKTHPTSKYAMLADEIRHPLNEFVYLWVNYGILAPLTLLGVIVLPYIIYQCKKEHAVKPFFLPLLGVLVFSCFSYPFHYPTTWAVVLLSIACSFRWKQRIFQFTLLITGGVMIVLAIIDATFEYKWNEAYNLSFKELSPRVLNEYETLHGYMHRNYYFLYNYAMTAFLSHDFDRAYTLTEECRLYWDGYNRELLAGDICYKNHKYKEAINHYTISMYMCPTRFAPLEGLYNVYDDVGDDEKRTQIAQIIATQHVKVHSPTIKKIKQNCQ